jgi:hypothetical protein
LKIWSQANSHCWALAARSMASTVSHTPRRRTISSSIAHFDSNEPPPSGEPARALLEIADHLAVPKLSSDHQPRPRRAPGMRSWRYPGDCERLGYQIREWMLAFSWRGVELWLGSVATCARQPTEDVISSPTGNRAWTPCPAGATVHRGDWGNGLAADHADRGRFDQLCAIALATCSMKSCARPRNQQCRKDARHADSRTDARRRGRQQLSW